MMLSGWGRFPRVECRWLDPGSADEAVGRVRSDGSLIPRGNGRSYGDAALNPRGTLSLLRNNRMLAFDAATGLLTCEAGLLLADILDVFMPRGWFPAVTPGTKFVTIGGMIAADVHGKNHHGVGSFGAHVDAFDLALADGRVVRCSRQENAELFAATRGGMGLTGLILRATFKLIPIETAFIRQEAVRAADLDDAMEHLEASRGWSYTVAWIDCSTRRRRVGPIDPLSRRACAPGRASGGQRRISPCRDRAAERSRCRSTFRLSRSIPGRCAASTRCTIGWPSPASP